MRAVFDQRVDNSERKNTASAASTRTNLCNIYVYTYKDRAAPPIGGPALHDSRVKTVQWREREGHDSYQEVELHVYVTNIRQEIVALLWSGLGHIHILAMGCGAKIGGYWQR